MRIHFRQSADDTGLCVEKRGRIIAAGLLLQDLAASSQKDNRHGYSNYRFIEKYPFHILEN